MVGILDFGGNLTQSPPKHGSSIIAIDNQSQEYHIVGVQLGRTMIVCVCNRLNESRIQTAIDDGAETPEAVYAGCGVKRNCGRCQETIAEMLHEQRKVLDRAA